MAILDQNTSHIYLLRADFGEPSREADWNRWYDEIHVPEILTVPGFVSVTRFKDCHSPSRYLAAYEVEGLDVFDEPRYQEVRGWGEWAPHVTEWRRAVYELRHDFGVNS